MRIKSYFATSVQSAMAEARRELGPEAMLLNSRKVSEPNEEVRYEVVFGLAEEVETVEIVDEPLSAPSTTRVPAPPMAAPAPLSTALIPRRSVPNSLSEIQRQVAELQSALAAAMATAETESAEFIELRDRLKEFDLGPEVTGTVMDAARERAHHRGLTAAVRAELESRLDYTDLRPGKGLVLVGPPGAGKTITLAKIAVKYGLAAGRGVRFIAFDAYRPAASEQLRSLALAMGAEFSREETLGGLVDAINRTSPDDLILIDTPGFSFVERPELVECAQALACLENLPAHLVLPASMKRTDLARYATLYSIFKPATLIFTRLDETECIGAASSIAIATGLAVSAHGCGPTIATDLQPAGAGTFFDNIFGREQLAQNVA